MSTANALLMRRGLLPVAALRQVNEHNAWIPHDGWLNDREKQAIVRFSFEYPPEGFRRLNQHRTASRLPGGSHRGWSCSYRKAARTFAQSTIRASSACSASLCG